MFLLLLQSPYIRIAFAKYYLILCAISHRLLFFASWEPRQYGIYIPKPSVINFFSSFAPFVWNSHGNSPRLSYSKERFY